MLPMKANITWNSDIVVELIKLWLKTSNKDISKYELLMKSKRFELKAHKKIGTKESRNTSPISL